MPFHLSASSSPTLSPVAVRNRTSSFHSSGVFAISLRSCFSVSALTLEMFVVDDEDVSADYGCVNDVGVALLVGPLANGDPTSKALPRQ